MDTSAPAFPLARILEELDRVGPRRMLSTLLDSMGHLGVVGLRLYFADVEERVLKPWGEAGQVRGPAGLLVPVEGSGHGRVYVTGHPEVPEPGDPNPQVLAAVTVRSERIGVLEAAFGREPELSGVQAVDAAGRAMGYVTIAADRWTDEFHVARRRQGMTLAAEVQWNFLPLAAISTDRVAVAGALEPAYDIAGDSFDYAYGRGVLLVGIFDAMGHGLAAARLSGLAVTAFRNARRRGDDLEAQARAIDEAIRPRFSDEGYVTGQIAAIDLDRPERSSIVNAGHPTPIHLRARRDPQRLALERADLPFGMPFPNDIRAQPLPLSPGDRLVLFSDGLLEARPDGGEAYGEERIVACSGELAGLPAREAARGLIGSVLEHREGALMDDATVMVVDLAGPEGEGSPDLLRGRLNLRKR